MEVVRGHLDARGLWVCAGCGRKFLTSSGLALHQSTWSWCSGVQPKTCPAIKRPRRRRRGSRELAPIASSPLIKFAARHDWTCYWCGEEVLRDVNLDHPRGPTREHLIPRSEGGRSVAANLRLAHKECNLLRDRTPVDEYFARIGRSRPDE